MPEDFRISLRTRAWLAYYWLRRRLQSPISLGDRLADR